MTMRRWRQPGLRGRLLAAVLCSVGLVLAVLIGAFNLVLHERLSHDADATAIARTSAELGALRVSRGRLAVPEQPDAAAVDADAWVFDGSRVLEYPRALPADDLAARRLSSGGRRSLDVASTNTRLYAVPVVIGGRRLGTVVAAVSLRPYQHTEQTALVASVVLGLLVLVVVGVAAQLVISGALRPVARMTQQAAEWRDSDIARRFEMGAPHDELTQLAATLDSLLERVATSLRHEQRFSAELSHELRTPLSNVIAQAQFALRHANTDDEYRAGHEQVLHSAEQMRRILDTLLAAARAELGPGTHVGDAAAAARAAAEVCAPAAAANDVTITVVGPDRTVRVGADGDLVERILAPLIENGCRHGERAVKVTVAPDHGSVLFVVEDDGPGVAAEQREAIFEPGARGQGRGARGELGAANGAGLGLALARRLARAAGGEVVADCSVAGGRFEARLPAA